MPTPTRPRRSSEAIAVIHPLVREVLRAADENMASCATYELETDENIWIQVTSGNINMAYPFVDEPMARVTAAGVSGRERLGLTTWEPNAYATFDYDPAASSFEVAELVDQLFLHVLGVPLVDGEDYPLTTEIFALASDADSPA
jgi:hypothetical protein